MKLKLEKLYTVRLTQTDKNIKKYIQKKYQNTIK